MSIASFLNEHKWQTKTTLFKDHKNQIYSSLTCLYPPCLSMTAWRRVLMALSLVTRCCGMALEPAEVISVVKSFTLRCYYEMLKEGLTFGDVFICNA